MYVGNDELEMIARKNAPALFSVRYAIKLGKKAMNFDTTRAGVAQFVHNIARINIAYL